MRNLFPESVSLSSPRWWVAAALLAFFALVPVYAAVFDEGFYLTLFSRIMVMAIAAISLNLLIGYTGLVSFGHALYLGLGAYAAGIASFHGITNGWLQLALAVGAGLLISFVTGLIVLRTSGMAFIMITLAFAQMFFYLGISLKQYGGDDGLRMDVRSLLAPFDMSSNTTLYYVIFAILVAALYLSWRLVHSRFGYVLRGIRGNERRMKAVGFSTRRYKLVAYMVAATVASVAGFLLANLTSYVSPSYGAWTVSGDLIVMVVLGGMGTILGPLVGALSLLLVEEWLASLTQHWMAPLGLAIVLIVLTARRGIYGSFYDWARRREESSAAKEARR
ncbi:MAG: branched-chain amino acid ABC transporter permease [Burkholderiaceae bacterium]